MHIHHVQFDVQGSDGVSAGFAYEHSVRPYQVTDPKLVAKVAKGATVLTLTDVAKFIGKDANGNATKPFIAVGEGTESIDIHQIKSVNAKAKTVTLVTPLDKPHAAGEFAGSEFIQYRWYPDVLLDNIFWHDHVDGIHGWGHGLVGQLIVEPKGSTYHDPKTGAQVDSGTLVDIHTTSPLVPGLVNGSFRELALWTIDDNDKGDYSTLNLRANPLVGQTGQGQPVQLVHLRRPGDTAAAALPERPARGADHQRRSLDRHPAPAGRADPARTPLRAARRRHGTQVNGPTLIDAVHYSVSEKFTLVFNGSRPDMTMRPGDYLYANGDERRTQDGAWGIVRILPGTVPDLQPLPGVTTPTSSYTLPAVTGGAAARRRPIRATRARPARRRDGST